MALFRRRTSAPTIDVPASAEALAEEIRRLAAAVRAQPDADAERRLLQLRHLAGLRALVGREAALAFAEGIERAYAARAAFERGRRHDRGLYEELEAAPPYHLPAVRPWIKDGGGVLAADAPRLF